MPAEPVAPVGEAATPADAWQRIIEALDEMETKVAQGQGDLAAASLLQAKRLYVQRFRERAISLSLDGHRRVVGIFGEAQEALDAGEAESVRAARLKMDAALTSIALVAIDEALKGMDVGQMWIWFTLVTRKFDLDDNPSPLVILVSESRRNPNLLRDVRDRISAGLLLLMVEHVQAGSEAALEGLAGGDEGAQELAEEALLLYQAAQGGLQEELGDEEGMAVSDGLALFKEAVGRKDLGEARRAADLVDTRLGPLSERLELRLRTPIA